MRTLPLTALVAALALSACDQSPAPTDEMLVNTELTADLNSAEVEELTAVEEDADTNVPAVVVPAVPKPAAKAPAAETKPLIDASAIETEIRNGRGIKRIRHGDGWAWTRDGKIIRTTDRDGKNTAYFRDGSDNPFFVQRGDHAFTYQDGKPVREFDRDGRAKAPTTDRVREAAEAEQKAREQRDRAITARDAVQKRPNIDRDTPQSPSRPGSADRPGAAPSPVPTPSASPTAPNPNRDRNRDALDNRAPTPRESSMPRREGERPQRERGE